MNLYHKPLSRRQLLKVATTSAVALKLFPGALNAAGTSPIMRTIPSSGEEISAMGMGSYITFDEKGDPAVRAELTRVLQLFFDHGGQLIDSSPMYGHAETALGTLLKDVDHNNNLFAATKVWTYGREAGIRQMNESMQKMGVEVMDLMQIHNLRDWKVHLPTLRDWKDRGKIRYLGITTSGGRDHDEFEQIMATEPLDFVQFTYNIENRLAEKRLLPLARDKGIATLINVPFGRGSLFKKVNGKQLPEWAAEFDCSSWAQFFLKFLIAHPQVSCVIPATSNPRHMVDNMGAGYGRLPDAETREKMAA
ncbi:MAG: aldo/keto reductase, partial [Gammaproteobacteria bacterium]